MRSQRLTKFIKRIVRSEGKRRPILPVRNTGRLTKPASRNERVRGRPSSPKKYAAAFRLATHALSKRLSKLRRRARAEDRARPRAAKLFWVSVRQRTFCHISAEALSLPMRATRLRLIGKVLAEPDDGRARILDRHTIQRSFNAFQMLDGPRPARTALVISVRPAKPAEASACGFAVEFASVTRARKISTIYDQRVEVKRAPVAAA